MKKFVVLFMALALAAALLPACNGSNGNNGGNGWIPVGLARSIDKQYGPVKVGTETTGQANALVGAGSHQATELKGVVSKDEVVQGAQQILNNWLPGMSDDGLLLPLPFNAGVDPCKQDSDNDGVPDIEEDKCDSVTDPHCDGLCVAPGLDTVKCTKHGDSFTIKFTDCQVNVTNTITPYTSVGTSTDHYNTVFMQTDVGPDTSTSVWKTTGVTTTKSASTEDCASESTMGVVGKIQAWNVTSVTAHGTNTTTTAGCVWEQGPGVVDGHTHDHVFHETCLEHHEIPCNTWNASSTTPGPNSTTGTTGAPTWTHTVECADGTWEDYTNVGTVSTTVTATHIYPYEHEAVGVLIGDSISPVHAVVNGSVTIRYGKGGVDEQVISTRYNKLTMVWGTGTPNTDTDPFITLQGQTMHYTVLDPFGSPASGTTWGGPNHNAPIDEMFIQKLRVESDQDGKTGAVWASGKFNVKNGFDSEDGGFLLTGNGDAIIALLDKNGNYQGEVQSSLGMHLIGINPTTGNPIYTMNAYEKGVGEANKCGVPANAPCKITMEIDPKARTFTVTAISGCSILDATDIPKLTGVSF